MNTSERNFLKLTAIFLFSSIFYLKLASAALVPEYHQGSWFLAGDAGLLWSSSLNNVTVNNGSLFPPPQNLDIYTARTGSNDAMLALWGGYRWCQGEHPFFPALSLALRYEYVFSRTLNGNVIQYSLPEFNNYTYSLKANADVLSLYSKWDLFQFGKFSPYVDGGLGASFIHGYGYQESALPGVTPRISPAFASHSRTEFAYNFGVGLDVFWIPQIIMSIGYDFQFLGNLSSGVGQGPWSNAKLNIGRYGANTALISFTYLMDNPFAYHYVPYKG